MNPDPFLNKLGFSDNDRAVIIHTDDIGMCHASVQAFKDLWPSAPSLLARQKKLEITHD